MNRHATDIQEAVPSLPLPADHVLDSGAVLFPGAFDQHGCPLIVFPVVGQAKLSSDLSKAEVVDFINYFLCLHNKKQDKDGLVSVVADLRQASLATSRFIAETLILLELNKRTVNTVYMIQPQKKDLVKLLLKLLAPSKSYTASFKKVLLKEVSELSNHIDRSQLSAPLGGYLIYCHQSWVAFIKEIDAFVQEFLSVVQRLPSCISTLQALSRLPVPATFSELKHFCSTNEATFQQLRRELGLDELLRHCECVVEKLRYPEKDPCYQAMAGTALFTHTAFDMLQNYSRITAAVEKVELLWRKAFSKARIHLQVFKLREEALQITEQIETLLKEKLHPYRIEIAKDAAKAGMLTSAFEASIHTPAMALVRCGEDVIHTLVEILPFGDGQTRERWVLDLERLKEKLHSDVTLQHQTLTAVSNYYHYYNKANSWYSLVLCENFLQELLSGVNGDGIPRQRQGRSGGTIPVWRQKLSAFLKRNPSPNMEELVHLARLANVIPDSQLQWAGKQLSQRCMTLRKLLSSLGAVAIGDLQLALQWQYELLRSSHVNQSQADLTTSRGTENTQGSPDGACHPSTKPAPRSERHIKDNTVCNGSVSNVTKATHHQALLGTSPSTAVSGTVSAKGKPLSLSSFDSGFDGAGSSHLEAAGGREGWEGPSRLAARDPVRPATSQPLIHEENLSSVSDSEDHREKFGFGSVGNSSRASIQIIPKVTVDSLNFEIRVKRSATLPQNPWLSLPVDDLENSYTVTITQNPPAQQRDPQFSAPSDSHPNAEQSNGSRDQPTQTEVSASMQSKGPRTRDWILQSQSSFEDPELSPISKVLSSTITDGRDKSCCTTEGIPTLLWDSYDLHDQNQDAAEGVSGLTVDLSLNDWDVKEQEGLREVEKILDRADEILEEEENVLAQEAMLDVLLRSEGGQNQWALWDSEDQLGAMASSELAEAGVLGLEDCHVAADSGNLNEWRSQGSASETEVTENTGCNSESVSAASSMVPCSRVDLLTELRKVHLLDELIVEENLKIHELRSCEETPKEELPEKTPDTNGLSSTCKERQVFRLQLEKEKREVERMEKSLNKELDRECKLKKHGSRARKVVKCSAMGKTRAENLEDQALCDKLLSGSQSRDRQTAPHLASSVPSNSLGHDTHITNDSRAELGPDTTPPDLDPPVDVQCQDDTDTNCNLKDLNSVVIVDTVGSPTELNRASDLKECSEEVGIQPQGCMHEKEFGENVRTCKPEASLTPEMGPDDGAFDPGGKSNLPPVPKPRKASLSVNNSLAEQETPHSTELMNTAVSSVAQDPDFTQLDPPDAPPKPPERKNKTQANSHTLILSPNVNEHSNNNNNNHPLPEHSKDDNHPLPEHSNNNHPLPEHSKDDNHPLPEHSNNNNNHPLPEHSKDYNHPLPEHSNENNQPLPEHSNDDNHPLPEHSNDDNNPLPEHSNDDNNPLPEHSNENNQPLPEHSNDDNHPLPEHSKDDNNPLPEHSKDDNNPLPEHSNDDNNPLPEHSNDNNHPLPEHSKDDNHPLPEHCNDNNRFLPEKCTMSSDDHESSEITTENGEKSTMEPVSGSLQTDLHLSEEMQTSSPVGACSDEESPPEVPPDLPIACDPGGRDDMPDGFQSSEATRISATRSPVNQAQLNINTREFHLQMSEFKTPIVLDTGSGLMKAGFADQDLPTIIFPTIIGQPKYEEIMNGYLERETYIGHEAQHMRGVLALKYPMKNGIIRNWDDMEKIWHHTFQQLSVDPEDHPVLLTEAAMNPRENRQRMVELMFECFSVPFTYVAMQAVLALYAAGRSTGVVFDSGDGVSHSVPVFDGYGLPHAVQRFPLAGGDVTMHLKKLLQEQGVCMRTTAEMEIVREIKEKCCCVALDYEGELAPGGSSSREMHYTMPDGQVICLSSERFRAPEILFKPELIGRDHYGMHESVFKSILSSDIDLRRGFLGNIVLSGGNTLLPGLPERLQAEIKGMLPSDMQECVRVTSPKDRDFSVWTGGAVLANLPSFTAAWISQEEYEEFGPQIVFRKCF